MNPSKRHFHGRIAAVAILSLALAGCAATGPVRPVSYDQANTAAWFGGGFAGAMGRSQKASYDDAREAREAGNLRAAAAQFRQLAADGVPEAAYELGKMYRYGEGVPRDHTQAAQWFIAAVSQPSTKRSEVSYHLGTMLLTGDGVPRDHVLARRLLEQALEGGYERAALPLARIYAEGLGIEPRPERARELAEYGIESGDADSYFWLMRAYGRDGPLGYQPDRVAELSQQVETRLQERIQQSNDPAAMRDMAMLYLEGLGRPRNVNTARDWLGRAAVAGRPDYLADTGEDLLKGDGDLPQDQETAIFLLRSAAERYDQPDAYALLGRAYRDGSGVERDLQQAEEWFRRGVEAGSTEARLEYGRMLADRTDNPSAQARAAELLENAAASGSPYALADLGTMHVNRTFPGANPSRGITYLRKAHQAGLPSATSELGQALLEGRGTRPAPGEAEELLKTAAEAGQGGAAITLANAYLNGTGLPRQPAKAEYWLKKAMDQDIESARLTYGRALLTGEIPGDSQQGYRIVREAAEAGDSFAMMELGRALRDGTEIPKDTDEARRWFERADAAGEADAESTLASMLYADATTRGRVDIAELRRAADSGHPAAMSLLGRAYLNGEGVEQSPIEAMSWLTRATEAGNAGAAAALGEALLYGEHGLDHEPARGKQLLERAARSGHERAQRELGYALIAGDQIDAEPSRGRELLRDSASRGDVYAMELLGTVYLGGAAGADPDPQKAERWLTRAAEEGDVSSMTRLGFAYVEGDVLEQDVERGMDLLLKSADKGDDTARAKAGRILVYGEEGVPADPERGEALLRAAADNEHAGAMSALGRAYVNGATGERRIAEGAKLLLAAARAGHETARYALAEAFLRSQGVEEANSTYAQSWLQTVVAGNSAVAVETLTEMLRESDVTIPAREDEWKNYKDILNARG